MNHDVNVQVYCIVDMKLLHISPNKLRSVSLCGPCLIPSKKKNSVKKVPKTFQVLCTGKELESKFKFR